MKTNIRLLLFLCLAAFSLAWLASSTKVPSPIAVTSANTPPKLHPHFTRDHQAPGAAQWPESSTDSTTAAVAAMKSAASMGQETPYHLRPLTPAEVEKEVNGGRIGNTVQSGEIIPQIKGETIPQITLAPEEAEREVNGRTP